MLRWLRLRKQVDEVVGLTQWPFLLLQSRRPEVFPGLWQSSYCCTFAYLWTSAITDAVPTGHSGDEARLRILWEAFTRLVEDTGGIAHEARKRVLPDGQPIQRRALADLTRVLDLYNGYIDDGDMIHPEYREAVYHVERSATSGGSFGLKREYSYEILFMHYLAQNAMPPVSERMFS